MTESIISVKAIFFGTMSWWRIIFSFLSGVSHGAILLVIESAPLLEDEEDVWWWWTLVGLTCLVGSRRYPKVKRNSARIQWQPSSDENVLVVSSKGFSSKLSTSSILPAHSKVLQVFWIFTNCWEHSEVADRRNRPTPTVVVSCLNRGENVL